MLMSEGEAGNELGGPDALDEGGEGAAEGATEKLPFAFTLCKDVIRKGSSMYAAECLVCGKKLSTTAHKMMYGHYMGKKDQHMSVHCVSVNKLRADHPAFLAELSMRWETLERKRTIRLAGCTSAEKRQKALAAVGTVGEPASDAGSSCGMTPGGSASQMGYSILSAGEKARLRDECQTAWDLAFVVAGIPFAAANNVDIGNAIRKTRGVPDFALACTKTMRTTHALSDSMILPTSTKNSGSRLVSGTGSPSRLMVGAAARRGTTTTTFCFPWRVPSFSTWRTPQGSRGRVRTLRLALRRSSRSLVCP